MAEIGIASGCVGLIGTVGETIQAVTRFMAAYREARADLADVARELSQLELVLKMLKEDSEADAEAQVPEPMRKQNHWCHL